MKSGRPADLVALVLYIAALAAAIVELFYLPFLFGPLGLLLVVVAVMTSASNRRLAGAAFLALGLGFVIGASIAVWYSNPLY
jgi:hypothetical protein